jgi:hypothetical protein
MLLLKIVVLLYKDRPSLACPMGVDKETLFTLYLLLRMVTLDGSGSFVVIHLVRPKSYWLRRIEYFAIEIYCNPIIILHNLCDQLAANMCIVPVEEFSPDL